MAKKEDVLAIIVPDSRETDTDTKDISLDFLFNGQDLNVDLINTEEELNNFIENMESINLIGSDKIFYHIDKIKEYLKIYKKKGISTINIDKFGPADTYVFYSLLALNGQISIINSSYANLIFIPKYMNQKQKKSMKLLQNYFDESDVFFMSKIESKTEAQTIEGISFNEVLENLNITNNEVKNK